MCLRKLIIGYIIATFICKPLPIVIVALQSCITVNRQNCGRNSKWAPCCIITRTSRYSACVMSFPVFNVVTKMIQNAIYIFHLFLQKLAGRAASSWLTARNYYVVGLGSPKCMGQISPFTTTVAVHTVGLKRYTVLFVITYKKQSWLSTLTCHGHRCRSRRHICTGCSCIQTFVSKSETTKTTSINLQ